MTNILLVIIIVLLIARFILQMWQAERRYKDAYATATNVRKVVVTAHSALELKERLCDDWWYCDYELVSIIRENDVYYAFLSQKKIKNYIEK